MLVGVCVVRMDLNGEFFLRENKFHEQWDAVKPAQARARPLHGQLRPDITERPPGKLAGSEAAFIAREPCLTHRLCFLGSFRKKRREIPCAPDAGHEDRGEPYRRSPESAGSGIHVADAAIAKNSSRRRKPSSIRSIEVA